MATTKIPANQYALNVKVGTAYVPVKGITSMDVSYSSTTVDGATFDLTGWSEDWTVRRSASVKVSGRAIIDDTTGENEPGQKAVLDIVNSGFGANAVGEFQLVFPGGKNGITFKATVGNVTPFGGSTDDLSNFNFDLGIQGAPVVGPLQAPAAK